MTAYKLHANAGVHQAQTRPPNVPKTVVLPTTERSPNGKTLGFLSLNFPQQLTEFQLGGSEIRTSDLSSPSSHLNLPPGRSGDAQRRHKIKNSRQS